MKTFNRRYLSIILALLGMIIMVMLIQSLSTPPASPPPVAGLVWPKPKPVPAFKLLDHNNEEFDLQRFKGQWSLLFFGYTQCPDICPITLTVLQGVKQYLQQQPERSHDTQYVFVSVDPQRDDAIKLKGYVEYFDPEFLGVTGDAFEISELARHLGIIYRQVKQSGTADDHYLINHSSAILLIDPKGFLVGVFTAPHEPEALAKHYLEMREFLEHASTTTP